MSGVAEFTLDREFFEEYYHGWIRHVRPWKRFLLAVAITGIGVGIGILVFAPGFSLTGWVVLFIAILETINGITRKTRRIRQMRARSRYGSRVVIEFAEESVRIQTSMSESRLEWRGFSNWFGSPKGLYLYCQPANGLAIYVPDRALKPKAAKTAIVEKLKQSYQSFR